MENPSKNPTYRWNKRETPRWGGRLMSCVCWQMTAACRFCHKPLPVFMLGFILSRIFRRQVAHLPVA